MLTLSGHHNPISSIDFSPDGLQLATASLDHTAKVWDVQIGHRSFTWGVTYSPDGANIATASMDGTAILWKVDSDNPSRAHVRYVLQGHDKAVFGVAFSPDGSRLATSSYDKTVKIWDTSTGRELLTLKAPFPLWRVAFSPNGKQIFAISDSSMTDGSILIWDLESSENGPVLVPAHGFIVYDLAFNENKGILATGGFDTTSKIWDWNGTSVVQRYELKHNDNSIYSVALTQGRRLVSDRIAARAHRFMEYGNRSRNHKFTLKVITKA